MLVKFISFLKVEVGKEYLILLFYGKYFYLMYIEIENFNILKYRVVSNERDYFF